MNRYIVAVAFVVGVLSAQTPVLGTGRGDVRWLDVQSMIDAAAARGGGVVRIEPGDHEVKPFHLKSNVTLELAEGARILASMDISDYSPKLGAEHTEEFRCIVRQHRQRCAPRLRLDGFVALIRQGRVSYQNNCQ